MTYIKYKNRYGARYYNLDISIYNYYDLNLNNNNFFDDMFNFCKGLQTSDYRVIFFNQSGIGEYYL